MKHLSIDIPGREYDIYIENGLLAHCGSYLAPFVMGKKAFVITDATVNGYYRQALLQQLEEAGAVSQVLVLPPGEQSKSLDTLGRLYEEITEAGITRKDCIIAFGGGVIGDTAGFAASTILRGVSYLQIPTTLLSQVDSSVGGKTAINLQSGKNLVGTFYQPSLVLIDPDLLKTLNEREFACGMAEIIKYGCIKDAALFALLEQSKNIWNDLEDVIATCCKIKGEVVVGDEFDRGERMLLNFGHTIGHAIEKQLGYGTWSHGAAVAAGMVAITRYSESMGTTPPGTVERIQAVNAKYHLPLELPNLNRDKMINSASKDKKSEGDSIYIVLLQAIGKAVYEKVPKETLKKIIEVGGSYA